MSFTARSLVALLGGLSLAAGCSSSPSGPVGGVVAGPLDAHCGSDGAARVVTVNPAVCHAAEPADGGTSGASDGGAEEPGGEYGETMFNAAGKDDDCKYGLAFTATDVRRNADVFFTLTLKYLSSGAAATGAAPDIEAYLDDTHPAPNSGQAATETGPGVYRIGPVRFDAAGRWTVRFHLYGSCDDSEASPHGHGAFYVDVP